MAGYTPDGHLYYGLLFRYGRSSGNVNAETSNGIVTWLTARVSRKNYQNEIIINF